ncbi:hypothetical protein AGMMS50256_35260 [Betaproteobacteria bacterium]|nr:hypothetical protein AGMMS50256_35260 [Betaproteobacteria bacterium]
MSTESLHDLEMLLTKRRIVDLEFRPVSGSFDVAHLKEVHRRIFQDFPAHGIKNPPPGAFREPVEEWGDWHKNRKLESIGGNSYVCYSPMNKKSLERLDQVLKEARPATLRQLKTAEFIKAFSGIYAQLDYIHPFHEGNSRTLRTFTRQIAKEAGYDLNWQRFNTNAHTRDLLYIARDRGVGDLAVLEIRDDSNLRAVVFCMDKYEKNPGLADLLQSTIRPTRAVSFEKLPEDQALRKHPELAQAFNTLHKAESYFVEKIPTDATKQQQAVSAVRISIQASLNEGETRSFQPSREKSQAKQQLKETPKDAPKPER